MGLIIKHIFRFSIAALTALSFQSCDTDILTTDDEDSAEEDTTVDEHIGETSETPPEGEVEAQRRPRNQSATGTRAGAGGTATSETEVVECYGDDTDIADDVPAWIQSNFACVTAYLSTVDGVEYVVFETDNLPNHKSPYWGSDSDYYEDIGEGQTLQNFTFEAQELTLKVPTTPVALSSPQEGFAGMVGVALNGIAFYGGESSTGSLDDELLTLDLGQGHSAGGSKQYHYHAEPTKFTDYSKSLLGVMIDGYPIYGPLEEDGSEPGTGSYPALEANSYGHTHATSDFPDGIFHYHMTAWDTSSDLATGVALVPLYYHGEASRSQKTN
ncbi:YHYH protein [Pseudobacteriovorax antillogorgiicola]|uniref:YHYH protein n=1 Tax=Pseudobacteriovorax antillogorgiicola TaxID=1513793 RepID=A0A1Y6BUR8_9BACT|nr:YHYH protein [Pseudobacteriovorax antillogorgiicola]TCS52402.1 YHYH protein [Pseudobacteriovorax antillogorgiicola]SMF28990.1 YHYH protein [Pseudobacteriovorax antillogorgiicola]